MEIIITAAIIILLLLIFGVSVGVIMQGILWILEILLLFMTLFFTVSIVFLFLGKKCSAAFLRIEKIGKLGSHAIYLIDGEERQNFYPAEDFFKKLIYRQRTTTARLWQHKTAYLLFDWYSMIIVGVGFPLSVIGAVLMGNFLIHLW